jgi:hypothetical protein
LLVAAVPSAAQTPGANGAISWVDECVLSGPTGLPFPGEVEGLGCYISGSWSPDGRLVAIVTDLGAAPGLGALWIWDDVADTLRPLGTADVDSTTSFSPDGSQLAIGRGGDIVVVSVATGATVRVLTPRTPTTTESNPTWNRRNLAIAYTAPDGVRSVKPKGGASRLVAAGAVYADFAPDGWHIGFTRHGVVYRAKRDGRLAKAIFTMPDGVRPQFAWSPDGRYLLSQDGNGGLQITSRYGHLVETGLGGSGSKAPAWQPVRSAPPAAS